VSEVGVRSEGLYIARKMAGKKGREGRWREERREKMAGKKGGKKGREKS
jgi:hypothetical protein